MVSEKDISRIVDEVQNGTVNAPQDDVPKKKADGEGPDDEALLERFKKLFAADKIHWDPIYNKARDDLKFLSDEPGAQWPEKEYADRNNSGRMAFTIDQLTQFVHQVANNIRMNTPSINPIPKGSGASVPTADVIKGLVKNIEYLSCADEVYDTAATSAVKCSIGFGLVDHDYADDEGFDQELQIKRVINPFLIYMDHTTIESDGRDQGHGTILERMKVHEYKRQWPDEEITSFDSDDGENKAYGDDDEITIAQFFIKDTQNVLVKALNKAGAEVSRQTRKTTIKRYKLSGKAILERSTFPGCYIPIVPFYGEEAWIDGKRNLLSLIRKSKEPQQIFNLMRSLEVDILLKQPFAPVMVPAGAIENYSEDWKNPGKSMALRYDMFDDEGRPFEKPVRLAPPSLPTGMVGAANLAIDDIKATTGMYGNSLGQQTGQETSGRAIDARKIQGDVATYHFGDNAVRSITQIGRIIVCAASEVYDTERVVQIIDGEDKPKLVGINGMMADDKQKESHDITKGKYDVRVITGPSFTTMRQESAAFYQDMAKSNPESLLIMGDLMFENMDVAGAPAMASRMKKIIEKQHPEFFDEGNGQDPQVMALQQQVQQLGQVIQQGAQAIQQLQAKLDEKHQFEMAKLQIENRKLDQADDKNSITAITAVANAVQGSRALDITEQKNAGDLALKSDQQEIDATLNTMNAIVSALPKPELPQAGNAQANDGSANNGVN